MTIHELDLILLYIGCQQLAETDEMAKKFKANGVSKEEIENYYNSCKRMINNFFRYNTNLPIPFRNVPFDED